MCGSTFGQQLLRQPGGPVWCVWRGPQCGSALLAAVHDERHPGRRAAENKEWGGIHDQHFHRYAEVSLGSEAFFTLSVLTVQFLCFQVRHLLLLQRNVRGGKSLGIWLQCFLLLLVLWILPSVPFTCGEKNPNTSPTKQEKSQPTCKVTKMLMTKWWVEVYFFLVSSLSLKVYNWP